MITLKEQIEDATNELEEIIVNYGLSDRDIYSLSDEVLNLLELAKQDVVKLIENAHQHFYEQVMLNDSLFVDVDEVLEILDKLNINVNNRLG